MTQKKNEIEIRDVNREPVPQIRNGAEDNEIV